MGEWNGLALLDRDIDDTVESSQEKREREGAPAAAV